MSRTARLLELMISLHTRPRFLVQELADEYGVSRRTMLRDLHALSEMGVPLAATPGPHGGYSVISGRKLLPLTLTADEAIGVLLSYEAFLQYAQSPFAAQSLSAITKLRQAMPADVLRELDRMRERVAIIEPPKSYEAPYLNALLDAALGEAHLRIKYESVSGVRERVIFPHGLFALHGYWYCACFDYRRGKNLMLRADRVLSTAPVVDLKPRQPMTVRSWLEVLRSDEEQTMRIRGVASPRGMKSVELSDLFGVVDAGPDGTGVINLSVPATELEYFATRLMSFGTDVVIDSPSELVELMWHKAQEIREMYSETSSSHS
jgi:predicted DNA-binding transcriptional regulator YafY